MAFPTLMASGGIKIVFLSWSILAILLFATIRYYPAGREQIHKLPNYGSGIRKGLIGILCLAGMFIYYSGQTAVWVYLERIGAAWDLGADSIADTLLLSLLTGIAGAALAIGLGNKFGRTIPITVSMLISAASIILLIGSAGAARFTFAACLFNFGWYLFLPYISAVIAAKDKNGNLLTGLAVAFPASLAVGPAFAAFLIGNTGSLLPALIFGLVSVPIGLSLILPATRRQV
jgi:hypothetical protein